MENSLSSMEKPLSSNKEEEEEESGWTVYFEDFATRNRDHGRESSSMISDATSSAAKKSNNKDQVAGLTLDRRGWQQLTSFKKRKAHDGPLVGDDAYEDTASSPVSSPKVNYKFFFLSKLHCCALGTHYTHTHTQVLFLFLNFT